MAVGSTRIAPNGYHYTKVQDQRFKNGEPYWRLTHHIKMEEYLGRWLEENERVHFRDNSAKGKLNFRPENLYLVITGTVTIRKKLAALYAKRDDINREITYWEQKQREAREN